MGTWHTTTNPCTNNIITYNFRFQVFTLFLGMFLFLPFGWMAKKFGKKVEKINNEVLYVDSTAKKKDYRAYLLIFPSLCDVFATILDCIALIFVNKILIFNRVIISFLDSCFGASDAKGIHGSIYLYVFKYFGLLIFLI